MRIVAKIPGTTANLGSGFDAFGLALTIYLHVDVQIQDTGVVIESHGEGAAELPHDKSHLIFRTIDSVFAQAGRTTPGMRLVVRNDIPLSRGLGSSGAAIIAGLLCGLKLAGVKLSPAEILKLANDAEGHPENAASSYLGGLTISCNADGQIIAKKISCDESLQAVVLIPGLRISTAEARKVLPATVSHEDAVYNLQRSALLSHAFLTQDFSSLRLAMSDRLHQSFRGRLIPGFDEFISKAYTNGALGAGISGSGSTLICFTREDGVALKQAWEKHALAIGLSARCAILGVDNAGAKVRQAD